MLHTANLNPIADFLANNPTHIYKLSANTAFMWCTKHNELVHVVGKFTGRPEEDQTEINRLRQLLNRL